MEDLIRTITVYAIPVLFAITLHEAAHGYVARHFGDATAYIAGRVSLNPLKHIDPVGTIIVPLAILLVSKFAAGTGFLFGWAKPVPVSFGNLRNPKRDMVWVAAAGPAANLLMAIGWALFFKLQVMTGMEEEFFREMANAGYFVNLGLMALNLLPIPPLDGGRIAVGLLPRSLALPLARVEPYGFFILLFVLAIPAARNFLLLPLLRLGDAVVKFLI